MSFVDRVLHKRLKTYNTFTGKADMRGKQYLLDLTLEGYPVIPYQRRTDKTQYS